MTYSSISFNTLSLPCFNFFHLLFYDNGVKIVPLFILDVMCPIVLAYWIMCDGSYSANVSLVLHTQSFDAASQAILRQALEDKLERLLKQWMSLENRLDDT